MIWIMISLLCFARLFAKHWVDLLQTKLPNNYSMRATDAKTFIPVNKLCNKVLPYLTNFQRQTAWVAVLWSSTHPWHVVVEPEGSAQRLDGTLLTEERLEELGAQVYSNYTWRTSLDTVEDQEIWLTLMFFTSFHRFPCCSTSPNTSTSGGNKL